MILELLNQLSVTETMCESKREREEVRTTF
jgi:hypothetical protein